MSEKVVTAPRIFPSTMMGAELKETHRPAAVCRGKDENRSVYFFSF